MNQKNTIIFLIILSNIVHVVYPELMAVNRARAITIGKTLTFAPTVANDAVIKITASNVILDLAERTISQSNATAGLSGIEIDPNLNNIIIRNGFIKNVTGVGIKVGVGCSNITIENIQLEGIGNRGIELQGTGTSVVDCCKIQKCSIRSSCTNTITGDDAILFENCTDSRAKNCVIEDCGNTSVDFFGVKFVSCTNCIIENVEVITCSGQDSTSFALESTSCSSLNMCLSRNNTSGVNFIGISISGTSNLNNFIDGCLISRNNATGNMTGLFLGANSQSNVAINSKILGNMSGGACNGIHLNGGIANNFDNAFINCLIQSNQTSSGDTNGILIDGSDFGIIERCIASFNSASAVCYGLNFQSGTGGNNWTVRVSNFVRNMGSSDANSYGILLQTGATNLFFNNVAFNNGTISDNQLSNIPVGSVTAKNTSNLNSDMGATNYKIVP